ncbi:hypothetical protein KM043_007578 [Ampulex compressa]|nr:hypothetical protein KM043_007578 [Ampulex compressa]
MPRQRVPPVCTVRRSRSFPNESETTDRAAELEDFLSSRSGVTDLSMDKQDIDDQAEEEVEDENEDEDEEEEEHWKDASPLTPVCSPKKGLSKVRRRERPSITEIEGQEFYTASGGTPLADRTSSKVDALPRDTKHGNEAKRLDSKLASERSAGTKRAARHDTKTREDKTSKPKSSVQLDGARESKRPMSYVEEGGSKARSECKKRIEGPEEVAGAGRTSKAVRLDGSLEAKRKVKSAEEVTTIAEKASKVRSSGRPDASLESRRTMECQEESSEKISKAKRTDLPSEPRTSQISPQEKISKTKPSSRADSSLESRKRREPVDDLSASEKVLKTSPVTGVQVSLEAKKQTEYLEETSASEKISKVKSSARVDGSMESKRPSKRVEELASGIEKVAPKVKLKDEAVEVSSARKRSELERRKTLRRHSSLDSEARSTGEPLDRSDTSSEKGARKKAPRDKDQARKRPRKTMDRRVDRQRAIELPMEETSAHSGRYRAAVEARKLEEDEEQKWEQEALGKRLKEQRKSLREQECIERVTEFLAKHSSMTFPDSRGSVEEEEHQPTTEDKAKFKDKAASSVEAASTVESTPAVDAKEPSKRSDEEKRSKLREREVRGEPIAYPSYTLETSKEIVEFSRDIERRETPERLRSEVPSSKSRERDFRRDGRLLRTSLSLDSPLESSSRIERTDIAKWSEERVRFLDQAKSPSVADSTPEEDETRIEVIARPSSTFSKLPTVEKVETLDRKEEKSSRELDQERRVQEKETRRETLHRPSTKAESPVELPSALKRSTPEKEVPEASKRPSSLRKRRDTFSRESSRESLLEEVRKEVRIQEDVQEIFFEDPTEQVSSLLPEVQLVKARIITAEEAASLRSEEISRIRIHSPPEVVLVESSSKIRSPGALEVELVHPISKVRLAELPSPLGSNGTKLRSSEARSIQTSQAPLETESTEARSTSRSHSAQDQSPTLKLEASRLDSPTKEPRVSLQYPTNITEATSKPSRTSTSIEPASKTRTPESPFPPDVTVIDSSPKLRTPEEPSPTTKEPTSRMKSHPTPLPLDVTIMESPSRPESSAILSPVDPNIPGRILRVRSYHALSPPDVTVLDSDPSLQPVPPSEIQKLSSRIKISRAPSMEMGLPFESKLSRAPSPEALDSAQLQLPGLAKSTSENMLAETKEENRVSERNLRPEILLDLSRVSEEAEQAEEAKEERRSLSRAGSEGSKKTIVYSKTKSGAKEERGFEIGSLAQPDKPELMVLVENSALLENWKGEGVEFGRSLGRTREEIVDRYDTRLAASTPDTSSTLPKDLDPSTAPQKPSDSPSFLHPRPSPNLLPASSTDLEPRHHDAVPHRHPPLRPEERHAIQQEDSLIRKEHSLEYQSQTLESQQDRLARGLASLESLPGDSWPRPIPESVLQEAKETQSSPKERCDAGTQTEQETKSTQCSPESPKEFYLPSSFLIRYQSPRREVQTQTQGESKSVQCCLDDEEAQALEEASLGESQESKSVQCIPEDILGAPEEGAPASPARSAKVLSPRREVEVQTYQESKAVQCSEDEFDYPASPRLQVEARQASSTDQKSDTTPTSSCCGSPRRFPTVVFVEGRADMTVTHREHDGGVAWAKHWGPERLVEIYREPKTSLGLSIVGGKVDLHNGSSSKSQNISGIFIKNVLPNSPAGRTGELKIGDRIIEVDGVDLRQSTHERAVEVIQAAGNPVCLLVQSLVHLSTENEGEAQGEEGKGAKRGLAGKGRLPASGVQPGTPTASFRQKPPPVSPVKSITPEAIQGGAEDGKQSSSRSDFKRQSTRASDGAGPSARRSSMKKSIRKKAPSPPSNPGVLREVREEKEDHASGPARRKYSSDESSEEEDTRMLEGNVYTKAGMEISRKSAGNVKRTKEEIEADPEKEDEFGYTAMKIKKKYTNLGHKVMMIKVEKDRRGLGISLAGHKDRNRMAVFVCGLNPKGAAHKGGELHIGDEILEVNGCVLQGRCHLNASALIKGMAGTCFKIIVVRRTAAVDDIAVKPIVQFPPTLEDADQFSQYRGVRNVPVKKGQYGLGIMIIEGKHAEVGQGIFISDIQEGSAAEQAGLQVGDMILAVNMDCLLGSTYDEATGLLKKAEGVVTLTVCNPNQSKLAKEEEEKAKGGPASTEAAAAKPAPPKEPEKPKEPEPPQDPKTCSVAVGKDTTIEFQKEKDKGIGFIIAGGSDTPMKGVFILEVFPDGAAGKDGRLQAGDQILDMCNQSFKAMEHEKAHAAVLKATGTIVMMVYRDEKPTEELDVELQKKAGKGAGLCLTGFKSGKGAYVSDLLPGGSALESGKICKGDQVVAVCGQDVREAPVEDIAVHVKVANPVQLKLARYKSAKQ